MRMLKAVLLSVMLARDAGADLSAALVTGMIEDRRTRLDDLLADEAHSETATGQLARKLIEAELSVLEAMAPNA